MMKPSDTAIHGVTQFDLRVFADPRGSLCEAFKASEVGQPGPWVQWNVSRSEKNVIRGLHFHRRQTDYWHIVSGKVLVAMVDLRPESPTHKVATCLELDATIARTLLIPPGVLHGFRALTDIILMYLLDREYDPSDENSVRWNDPDLHLPAEWYAHANPLVSSRDANAPMLSTIHL